jgi:hypothetical protein
MVINSDTAEIEQEFNRTKKEYSFKGFSIYASIVKGIRVSKDRFADCLILLVNSKALKSNYLQGITVDNIKQIYNQIIEVGIIDCSYDEFLNGAGTDVDFKCDFTLPLDEYKELIKVCALMTKESSNRDKGSTTFKEKTNYGISWSVRKSSKYLTNPYLKIYHKEIELKERSNDFRELYLNDVDITNRIRIETTVKNRTHFKKLGLNSSTLKDILYLSQEQIKSIFSIGVNSHLLPRTKAMAFKTKHNLTPTKQIYLNTLLVFTSELNYTIERSINILINNIENKGSKSLNKTTLNELYIDHIKNTNYDSKASKIDKVFDSFGWF